MSRLFTQSKHSQHSDRLPLSPPVRVWWSDFDLLSHASFAACVAISLASSEMSLNSVSTSGTPSRSTGFLVIAALS